MTTRLPAAAEAPAARGVPGFRSHTQPALLAIRTTADMVIPIDPQASSHWEGVSGGTERRTPTGRSTAHPAINKKQAIIHRLMFVPPEIRHRTTEQRRLKFIG
jgi:hypothetical protein